MRIEKRVRKILKQSAYGAVSATELRQFVTQWLEDIEAGHLQSDDTQDYMIDSIEDLIERMEQRGFTDEGLDAQDTVIIEQMVSALNWIGAGQGGAGKAQGELMAVLDIAGREPGSHLWTGSYEPDIGGDIPIK